MIILNAIDTIRDGGSIVMKLWTSTSTAEKYNLIPESPGTVKVIIDYGARTTTPGHWYNVCDKGKVLITSNEFKDSVMKELEKKIEKEQFYLHKLMNDYVQVKDKS